MRILLRRLLRSSFLGMVAAYFLNPKRGAARRARAQRLLRSLKARVVNQVNARRSERRQSLLTTDERRERVADVSESPADVVDRPVVGTEVGVVEFVPVDRY